MTPTVLEFAMAPYMGIPLYVPKIPKAPNIKDNSNLSLKDTLCLSIKRWNACVLDKIYAMITKMLSLFIRLVKITGVTKNPSGYKLWG